MGVDSVVFGVTTRVGNAVRALGRVGKWLPIGLIIQVCQFESDLCSNLTWRNGRRGRFKIYFRTKYRFKSDSENGDSIVKCIPLGGMVDALDSKFNNYRFKSDSGKV